MAVATAAATAVAMAVATVVATVVATAVATAIATAVATNDHCNERPLQNVGDEDGGEAEFERHPHAVEKFDDRCNGRCHERPFQRTTVARCWWRRWRGSKI